MTYSLDWQPYFLKSKVELKLDKFSELKKGWRYGEGEGPKPENIERARLFDKLLEGQRLYNKDVFPGAEGDLTLEIYFGDRTLEITFKTDDKVSFELIEDNETISESSALGTASVAIFIEILQRECKLSDFYTLNSTAYNEEDLHQTHFRIYVEPSPLSNVIA